MTRKSIRANNSFLLGSLIMIVLVLAVVVLFLFYSFRIFDKQKQQYANDRYEIVLGASTLGNPITVYLNDSLLFKGTPQSVTTLSIGRFAGESSLLVGGTDADKIGTFTLPESSAKVTVEKVNGSFEFR